MPRKPANDWLRDVGRKRPESYTLLLDALFHLQPQDVRSIVRQIRDFEGTKVMVSCTDRTHLEQCIEPFSLLRRSRDCRARAALDLLR